MNCPDFEIIIDDLARERMMEAAERASGLAHAETCARCASRLADERSLTFGLRSLATSAQEAEAPARVEAALLAAFRERDKAATLHGPTAQPPTAAAAGRYGRRWALAAALSGAATAAALALLFAAFVASRTTQPRQSAPRWSAAHDSQPLKPSSWPTAPEDERALLPGPAGLTTAARRSQPRLAPAPARMSNGIRRSLIGGSAATGSIESPQPEAVATNSVASDIATDFIPLTYGGGMNGLDSGRVVRVELPRSALARFGLPVNAERAGEPVKADVLLGEDGLARAIRFVR
ncbi:MAG TPA: hypothetical protein VE842_06855 [Pyrinomonadaceae bacterium]|jgi:hypothetical protein|nr:hypothetical protein [Pyrinomonadaceae bacterium]